MSTFTKAKAFWGSPERVPTSRWTIFLSDHRTGQQAPPGPHSGPACKWRKMLNLSFSITMICGEQRTESRKLDTSQFWSCYYLVLSSCMEMKSANLFYEVCEMCKSNLNDTNCNCHEPSPSLCLCVFSNPISPCLGSLHTSGALNLWPAAVSLGFTHLFHCVLDGGRLTTCLCELSSSQAANYRWP